MLSKKSGYQVAVVGATGAVGREMISILEERDFPVEKLTLLASARSAGNEMEYKGEKIPVQELTNDSFAGIDVALFSAGASVSREYAPIAAKVGCVAIDNSSAFRMDKDIPLVVPEVNPDAIGDSPGIIANPNCSTIQMVVALNPLHKKHRIKRVVVSTYQAVSGSGKKAVDELKKQNEDIQAGNPVEKDVYPHQIASNCLPHIDVFLENGYTKEEMKMVNETKKIMSDDSIMISPTAVRVPVVNAHSESINVEMEDEVSAHEVRSLLSQSPGLKIVDSPEANEYPLSIDASGRDEVFVGRIREDLTNPNAINFWVVADNLRKGAALNAVQIAELLLPR
jgi:aspartate-semialdehyde dehydrogenase